MPKDDDDEKIIEIERELDKLRVVPTIMPATDFKDIPCPAPAADVDHAPEPPDIEPAERPS